MGHGETNSRIGRGSVLLLTIIVVTGLSCKNDTGRGVDRSASNPPPAPRGDCYVTASTIPDWKAADDLVIVDTRPADDFRRMRIPGSINVPAFAVSTKTYLRSKRLLLVNRGGTGIELEPLCKGLRDAGFTTVGILEGGLAYWGRNGGQLAGDARAIRALNRISSADLGRDMDEGRWLIVDVSPAGTPGLGNGSDAVHLPAMAGDALRRALRRALRNNSENQFVLVADQYGESYGQVIAELTPLAITHLYFLEGGIAAYRNYRDQQEQIAAVRERPCAAGSCGVR